MYFHDMPFKKMGQGGAKLHTLSPMNIHKACLHIQFFENSCSKQISLTLFNLVFKAYLTMDFFFHITLIKILRN